MRCLAQLGSARVSHLYTHTFIYQLSVLSKLLPIKELAELPAGFLSDGCLVCANSSLWAFCLRFVSIAGEKKIKKLEKKKIKQGLCSQKNFFGSQSCEHDPSGLLGLYISLGASTKAAQPGEMSSVMESAFVPLCLGRQQVSVLGTRGIFGKAHPEQRSLQLSRAPVA